VCPPPQTLTATGRRLDPGVRVGSLSPAHVDLVDETWAYGGNARSRRYLAEVVGGFPTLCLHEGSGGPFCWVLSDPFGAAAHGYTLPSHRRRGHMLVALGMAARRARARGFEAFGHTVPENRAMQRVLEELGYRQLPARCRYVLHNPGLARAAA